MSTKSHQARQTIKQEKESGTLINASGRAPTLSVVFLDNGSVIASPFTVKKLMNDIIKANSKVPTKQRERLPGNITVYDVKTIDDLPDDDRASDDEDEQDDEDEEEDED